ncbi:hypothetical protein E2542_SST17822 [Spatholobus suberectus]|nr:hypothetical protein E2542_SST17822 [Spatholobus suberectus]
MGTHDLGFPSALTSELAKGNNYDKIGKPTKGKEDSGVGHRPRTPLLSKACSLIKSSREGGGMCSSTLTTLLQYRVSRRSKGVISQEKIIELGGEA